MKYVKNILSGSFRAMLAQAQVDELLTRVAALDPSLFGAGPPSVVPGDNAERGRLPRRAMKSRLGECEEGDLNPTALVKFLRVFASPTAKNRHLPPRGVSGGHICVGPGADVTCG